MPGCSQLPAPPPLNCSAREILSEFDVIGLLSRDWQEDDEGGACLPPKLSSEAALRLTTSLPCSLPRRAGSGGVCRVGPRSARLLLDAANPQPREPAGRRRRRPPELRRAAAHVVCWLVVARLPPTREPAAAASRRQRRRKGGVLSGTAPRVQAAAGTAARPRRAPAGRPPPHGYSLPPTGGPRCDAAPAPPSRHRRGRRTPPRGCGGCGRCERWPRSLARARSQGRRGRWRGLAAAAARWNL